MIDWESEATHWRSRWEGANAVISQRDRSLEKLVRENEELRRSGDWAYSETIGTILDMLEETHPEYRVTRQRREIANLHKVIRRLRDEIKELRGE